MIDMGQFMEADSILELTIRKYDSPRAYFERARLDIRRNDTTAYCQDLYDAQRMNVDAVRSLYTNECITTDSGVFNDFHLDSTLYPGMVNVIRYRYKQDNSTAFVLLDKSDSARIRWFVDGVDTLFHFTDNNPSYPGGTQKMMEFFGKNMKYPDPEYDQGVQGTVQVQFIVEPDGTLSHLKVFRNISPGLDGEAIRLFALMPKWVPGTLFGRAARFRLVQGLHFRHK